MILFFHPGKIRLFNQSAILIGITVEASQVNIRVNDAKNGLLYSEYKKLADAENNVIFGGRLGEYKYYDMDQVIAAVLDRCEKEF